MKIFLFPYAFLLMYNQEITIQFIFFVIPKIVERMDAAEQQFNARVESGYRVLQQGPAAALDAAG
ncbi:MAG: hypothetical protein SPL60_07675, partial [Lachnospiraceae bacterium]|nr:hypothetical protein [Lachnospiraceae bacterium]